MITKTHKLSIITLKYAPLIGAVVMMIHVVLLLHDIEIEVADWIFSLPIFPCVVCFIWSKAFGFCALHRLYIIYTCTVSYCIKYQNIFGFGSMLVFIRYFILILGIILLIALTIHKINGNYSTPKKTTITNNN